MKEKNLLDETLEILERYGKTPTDVRWIGSNEWGWFTWNDFAKIASEAYYDSDFGLAEVAIDLVVAGNDWWLERGEYDGKEWWEFKCLPDKPEEYRAPKYLTSADRNSEDILGDATLSELNDELER